MTKISSDNIIPTKYELTQNYWYISPGTLSLSLYKKSLVEISTVSYDPYELEFIFYVSISNLIKQLELFSFDFTPILIHIIKQQLSFFKTLCVKQKYAHLFISSSYIDQLSTVFHSLIELKRWRYVEQQFCIDEIERVCNFFKSRLRYWFQSSHLKAYLWRWGFKENINAIMYYSFLIPKVQKFVDAMLKDGSQYLEKIELRCKCSISMNFDMGVHMYEFDYFLMEVVFDLYQGKPLGFLDMLRYLMKSIHLTQYFLKNLRTVVIKDSANFIFLSNAPLRTLRLLGKNIENGESISPFFSKLDCTKKIFSRNVSIRSQSADSGGEDLTIGLPRFHNFNWTSEMDVLDYWKTRIRDLNIDDFKNEVHKINDSYYYWENIYKKLVRTSRESSEGEDENLSIVSDFDDLIKRCQEQFKDQIAFLNEDLNADVKAKIHKQKLKANDAEKKDEDLDSLYEQLFFMHTSNEMIYPSVTNMRYLMRKQTGLKDKRKFDKKQSSNVSTRTNLLTNQTVFHLRRSSLKFNENKFTKKNSKMSVSTLLRFESIDRKMVEEVSTDSEDHTEDALNKLSSHLKMMLNGKSQNYVNNWIKILKLDYDWSNLQVDLQLDGDKYFECCPIEFYNKFKNDNPIPTQMKNTPLISIFLTLQILTDKTIVYNTHFRELNEGKSIDIPIILEVNKTNLKPTFFGYLNPKQSKNSALHFQLLICQLSFDMFLLSQHRNEFLKGIFFDHMNNLAPLIESQSAKIISEIEKILKLKDTLTELNSFLNLSMQLKASDVEKLIEVSDEYLFLHEFLSNRKCCNWLEHKYYGIRILYHSLFVDGNTKCIEPFLRLPGDRRIKKIENRCNSIIALREIVHSVLNTKRYLIEIYYDLFSGNHFCCVELIGSMLVENYGKSSRLVANRTLICYPTGELWVFSDIEWLKTVGNPI